MSLNQRLIKRLGLAKTAQPMRAVKEIDRFYQIKMFFILLLIITITFGFFLISNNDAKESVKDVYAFWGFVVIGLLWLLFSVLILISYVFILYKKLITKIGLTKANTSYINISICSLFLIIATYGLLHSWMYNSLKPDEEMLAHFKANRAAFETLASEHRSLPDIRIKNEKYEWEKTDRIKTIKQKLTIDDINEVSPLWLPNPYSVGAIHQLDELIKKQALNDHQASTLEILLKDGRDSWSLLHLKFFMKKSYVHFPVTPKIEQSQLLYPWIFTIRRVGKKYELKTYFDVLSKPTARLLDSLDGYPSDWAHRECVYKKIDGEAQWFLKMCGN